ncbi:MAG: TrkA family potassium uptake protein [Candidatus Latescibacterota bacterium]
MRTLIAGQGSLLYFLCRSFASAGHAVTVVNPDRQECMGLAERLRIAVVHGDATRPAVLADAGVRQADIALAATPRDPDNLVVCQLAGLHFGVPRVLALVDDPDNEAVFRELGVEAFSLTRTLVSLIEQQATLDQIASFVPVGQGKVNLTEVVLAADSPLAGRRLDQARVPQEMLVACLVRDGRALIPRGTTALQAGDRVIVISLPESHGRAIQAITGQRG